MTQVTEKQKNVKKKFTYPFVFLSKLTRNSTFFLLIACVFLLLLYCIGNYQGFVDETQLLILSILSFTSIVLCLMSFLSFVQEIVFLFTKKRKTGTIFSILFFLFTFVLGIFFISFSSVIHRLSLGI